MIAVALWVTGLPGAVGHMRAFGTGPLLLATAGLLLLCLLRTPLRWSGAVLAVVASLWALDRAAARRAGRRRRRAPPRSAGRTGGCRCCRAAATPSRSRNGWPPTATRATPRTRACTTASPATPSAASASSRTGGWPPWRSSVEAFAEDCARAAVVVSARAGAGAVAPPRWSTARSGARTAPWRCAGTATVSRRLSRARPAPTGPGRRRCVAGHGASRRQRRDATPKPEDLEPGD